MGADRAAAFANVHRLQDGCWASTRQERYLAKIMSLWGSRDDDLWIAIEALLLLRWDGAALNVAADFHALAVHGRAADDAWAVGASGDAAHWDGRAWQRRPTGTDALLEGVWCAPGGQVFASSRDGRVLRWDGEAWAGGAAGNLWRWREGGAGWQPVALPEEYLVNAIGGRGRDEVWLAARPAYRQAAVALRWDGAAWQEQQLPSTEIPRSLWAVPGGGVWIGASHDTLMTLPPGGN